MTQYIFKYFLNFQKKRKILQKKSYEIIMHYYKMLRYSIAYSDLLFYHFSKNQ